MLIELHCPFTGVILAEFDVPNVNDFKHIANVIESNAQKWGKFEVCHDNGQCLVFWHVAKGWGIDRTIFN